MHKFKTPCPTPGCRALWNGQHCTACGRKRTGWKSDTVRGTAAERGYDADWLKLRDAYITEHPWCEDCYEKGKLEQAKEVHHKRPFKGKDDPLRLDWSNLRSLCKDCHARVNRERRRRTLRQRATR